MNAAGMEKSADGENDPTARTKAASRLSTGLRKATVALSRAGFIAARGKITKPGKAIIFRFSKEIDGQEN
jgi:hypothetical protein